jgi:hypothetical protein
MYYILSIYYSVGVKKSSISLHHQFVIEIKTNLQDNKILGNNLSYFMILYIDKNQLDSLNIQLRRQAK